MRSSYFLILIIALLISPTLDALGQLNSENIKETLELYDSSLRHISAEGTFSVKSLSSTFHREFKGTFELKNNDSKFSLAFDIQESKGIETAINVRYVDNLYRFIGDGESILGVRFAPSITTGCDASLYSADGFDYLIEFPEMPIKPSLGAANFSLPSADKSHLDTLESNGNGLEGTYQIGETHIVRFLLLPEFDFAMGRRKIERMDGSVRSLDTRTYKRSDGQVVPVSFRYSRYTGGMPDRIIELEFDQFVLNASNDPTLFTINGVDFCKKARIVDNTANEISIVHSLSGDGFRSNNSSLKSAVEEFRDIERTKTREATHD